MIIADIKNKERTINELMGFVRKVLMDPEICPTALEIARKHLNKANADQLIAEELSDTTSIRIPAKHSPADELFLQVLKDVVRDETALY